MQKQLIFILGMHRSGTSAMAKLVQLLGAALGPSLMPPTEDNSKGYFENQRVVELNREILHSLGFYWDATLPLPEGWLHRPEMDAFKKTARIILKEEFGSAPLVAMKDPRLCRLLPFWLEVCAQEGCAAKAILVLRSPMEIAASLRARDNFSDEKGLLLWAEYFLEAEYHSRALPRACVTYDQLLQSPETISGKLGGALQLQWPHAFDAIAPQVSEFLDAGLRHHRHITSPNNSWISNFVNRLEPFTEHPDIERLDALRVELLQKLDATAEVGAFWHKDAMEGTRTYREHLTKMHEKNLEIGALGGQVAQLHQQLVHANSRLDILLHQNDTMKQDIAAIRNSTSWKITAPFRKMSVIARNWKKFFKLSSYQKAFWIVRQNGLFAMREVLREMVFGRAAVTRQENYHEWIARYETLTPERLAKLKTRLTALSKKPLISILMPVYNVEEKWLKLAVESVQRQIYENWELCIADDASTAPHIRPLLEALQKSDSRIKVIFRAQNGHISESSNSALQMASGEFVVLMDHDDVLSPEALFWVADGLHAHPDAKMMYSDEDKIDPEGNRYSAYFKSDWNTDLFYAHNMFSHMGVFERALMQQAGGFRKGFEGSQDYDLALRCLERVREEQIIHIPRVLYHWRAIPGSTSIALSEKDYAGNAAQKALYEHFARRYPGKKIQLKPTFIPGSLRVQWPLPEKLPMVSLVIPTRNGYEVLSTCIASILKKTRYPNYEILIVDNQSDDPKTLTFFDKITQKDARIRVIPYNHPFNYSAINNFAVKHTQGDLIGLINNDIEVMDGVEPDWCWLTEMVSLAVRPEVGAVGAKLYYPNGTVQHGGVLTGLGGCGRDHAVAGHLFVGLRKEDAGYFARGIVTQQLSGVTAACMILRREVFDAVGGLDEHNLPVAFNDVDLCLKIRKAGYKIIWTPYAELYHHESISRGKENTPEKKARAMKEIVFMREKWGDYLLDDAYYNPNLDYLRGNFGLAFPPRTGV